MCLATANGAKDSSKFGIGMMHLTGVSSAARAVIDGSSAAAALPHSTSRRVGIITSFKRFRRAGGAKRNPPWCSRSWRVALRSTRPTTESLRRRLAGLVEHFLWRHRHDLGIGRHEMPALDQLHEFRPDLARDQFADAAVLVDVAPFADQVEMVGVGAVAAQHAVLHLRGRAVERVVVA